MLETDAEKATDVLLLCARVEVVGDIVDERTSIGISLGVHGTYNLLFQRNSPVMGTYKLTYEVRPSSAM